MSKIICDVCGTRYPDTADQCPICGCSHQAAAEPQIAEPALEEEIVLPTRPATRGGRFSKANVRKRNRDQAVYEEPEVPVAAAPVPEDDEDSFEEFEEANSKGGVLLNVLLVVVIMALLAVSAYIFMRFFMPKTGGEEPVAPTDAIVETLAPETDAPTEAPTDAPTEAPDVPCEKLVMEVTDIILREPGAMFLLNVQVLPENTTDTMMYISSNEEVATVNEEGRVTAVGEGTVVISMFCGEQQIECNVICDFGEEEPTLPGLGETEAPTEEATEAPTEKPADQLKDVVLGVKSSDLTFRTSGQQATIKLTCKLDNDEVTWTSADESIATVDGNGVITRVGTGTTTITGQYGDQKVEVIVRCPRK